MNENNLHEEILDNLLRDYNSRGKVIRLDCSYTPDGIFIDWENRKVYSLEAESSSWSLSKYTGNREIARSKKNIQGRIQFDGTVLYLPLSKRFEKYTPEIYDKAIELNSDSSYTKKEIAEQLNLPYSVVLGWLSRNIKPWAVKIRDIGIGHKNLKINLIFLDTLHNPSDQSRREKISMFQQGKKVSDKTRKLMSEGATELWREKKETKWYKERIRNSKKNRIIESYKKNKNIKFEDVAKELGTSSDYVRVVLSKARSQGKIP